ncbi:hypothetical protein E1B28_005011 [Marasmius oreades]|uniref:Uncharacterized protein n=1 Tax=Marasmius oreades TaxID=181124 RepID=A0A9P7UZR3_9AGAR|nr:uncharacterized protein E1B28_005011 [Marasmius oreades]KAG7097686.1 hypothetical protein E1B28_005011 [Marasmius oreades]
MFNSLSPSSRNVRRHVDHDTTQEHEFEQLILSSPGDGKNSDNLPFHRFQSQSSHWQHTRRICWTLRRVLPLRRVLLLLGASFVIFVLVVLRGGIPPTFTDVRTYESRLPQHNVTEALFDTDLKPPGRRKYLRLEGGAWGVGLNNVLQQVLHMSYLAHKSGRVYVFEDYTWSHKPFRYTLYDYALRPTTVPLNAIISGASSGGVISSDGGTNSFRSVSLEFFDSVCPEKDRVVLDSAEAPLEDQVSDGVQIVDWWLERLRRVEDEPCVVIHSTQKNQVFDWIYFGTKLPLSVLPALTSSPMLTQFAWSPIVLSAVARNFAVLQPSDPRTLLDTGSSAILEGLVAVHLRRGDFQGHCRFLHKHRAQFIGINRYHVLPDRFHPSPRPDSDASRENYVRHCIPEVEHIVERLRKVREENPSLRLRRVYLLSNGSRWWLTKLAKKLVEDGWGDVSSTNDIRLDDEQVQVSGAVDMAIAGKAEVFVGNGFSTLSANIIMLRLAKELKPESNRFL